jgi:hypothetical protein
MPPVRKVAEAAAGGGGGGGGAAAEESAVNVPLAVGPVKHDLDKGDPPQPCCVVDMVVHPDVVADCERDPSGGFRHWLVQLASQYMARKHGLELSPQYRLPRLAYKGASVTQQRIRRPAAGAKGIQEVTTTQAAGGAGAGAGAGAGSGHSGSSASFFSDRVISAAEQEAAAAAQHEADLFLAQLAATVPVDVMPGDGEPSGHMLPQQPLHACLLPTAARFSSVHAVTNPYSCEVGAAPASSSDGDGGGGGSDSSSSSSGGGRCGVAECSAERSRGRTPIPVIGHVPFGCSDQRTFPGDGLPPQSRWACRPGL